LIFFLLCKKQKHDDIAAPIPRPNATLKGGAARADVYPDLEAVWQRQTEGGGLHIIAKVCGVGLVVVFSAHCKLHQVWFAACRACHRLPPSHQTWPPRQFPKVCHPG
jgi:hypothetical protein